MDVSQGRQCRIDGCAQEFLGIPPFCDWHLQLLPDHIKRQFFPGAVNPERGTTLRLRALHEARKWIRVLESIGKQLDGGAS